MSESVTSNQSLICMGSEEEDRVVGDVRKPKPVFQIKRIVSAAAVAALLIRSYCETRMKMNNNQKRKMNLSQQPL
eukprot:scaffold18644_cov116-Skeletonema_marinoi.AAC.3